MKTKNIAALLWAFILLVVLLTWLTGCVTQKKAEKFYQKHPDKLAEKCAASFPVKDSTIIRDSISFDTLYIDGEPVYLKDTVYMKGDTVVKIIEKKCPLVQTVTKTVRHDSIIYRRDRAFEQVLQDQNVALNRQLGEAEAKATGLEDELSDMKAKRSKWRLWCLITWVACGLYVGLKIKKVLPF